MPIQLEKRGDVFILTPDLDGITDQAFAEMTAPDSVTLRDAYSSATKAVIFDLRNIDFIDSHGVGLMVGVRACMQEGRAFVICGLNDHLRGMMTVRHLDDLAEIYDDLDQALASL